MLSLSTRVPFVLLLLSSLTQEATPFAPSPSNIAWTTRISRPLTVQLQLTATPFEELEKEDEMNKEADEDDWTPVKGGFLPRLLARTPPQKQLITEVATLEDYKREVVDCDEQVVVVKFYSTWCRSCKAMAPLYKKLANSLTEDNNKSIKFVQVPVTQHNSLLHQGLGIPSVPFGHIYHKDGGLVEELSLNKKHFGAFKDVLQQYVNGGCETELLP
jgi:thiol-disulfide isomerase/thioredoxin